MPQTVIGIHNAIAAMRAAGWDQIVDANGEQMLVGDLETQDEGDTSEYVIDADAVILMRDGIRHETIWTRTDAPEADRFIVVRKDNGPSNPHTGVVSQHDTAAEAFAAIDKANRKLRKQAGYQNAWHPFAVLDRVTGDIVREDAS
jgi:hypothetical protein